MVSRHCCVAIYAINGLSKIIKKIEEEIIQKHKLTDKVEILNKALEHFNSNVDKYLV